LACWGDKLLIADTYNHKIKVLDPNARTVNSFAGTGKPGQSDGATSSFYEPGGLAVAGDKLYVADTNNHAIRVVDLKTRQTRTLPIKGLQPPQIAQAETAEAAPNQEEIKLRPQKLREGNATVVINLDLPAGYHLNPTAPQRYQASIQQGLEKLSTPSINANQTGKGVTLPIRVAPLGAGAGSAIVRVTFTFVYCRKDNTGVCRIKTVKWEAPVEVTSDPNAPSEINLSAKVTPE
jgi:NHL repeat-containing protein